MTDSYTPGVCNIGPAEIARRRDSGIAGLAIGVAVAAGLVGLRAPRSLRLLSAVPLACGASGLLQARARFCSGFGLAGRFNFATTGTTESVEDAADRAADRRTALRILGIAGALGAAAAGLTLLLP